MKFVVLLQVLTLLLIAFFGQVKGAYLPKTNDILNKITELAMFVRVTYLNDPSVIQGWSCGSTCNLAKVTAAELIQTNFSRVAILVQPVSMKDTAVLAFRGTKGIRDWMRDVQALTVDVDYCGGPNKVTIHKGFGIVYEDFLASRLFERIQNFIMQTKSRRLIITGHSLGAAMATMVACAVKSKVQLANLNTDLVTFGSPRVGFQNLMDAVNRNVDTWHRFAYYGDPVAYLPAPLPMFEYIHGGKYVPLFKDQWCMSNGVEPKEYVLPAARFDYRTPVLSLMEQHLRFCNFYQFFFYYDAKADNITSFPTCKLTEVQECEREKENEDHWVVKSTRNVAKRAIDFMGSFREKRK